MKSEGVEIISTCTVQPLKQTTNSMGSLQKWELTPWDLSLLTIHYIQKGLLFQKPQMDFHTLLDDLKASLSYALDYFLPLAGRLAITTHDDVLEFEDHSHPTSISFFIEGNGAGAEFIHAAVNLRMSDILAPLYVPRVVHSFFPLKEPFNYKGCTYPLLAVQVTELIDAIFIGCSINHTVIDGTSFWHFFNSWSEICRGGNQCTSISRPPLLDRWFLNDGDGDGDGLPPIRLNVSLKFLVELSTSPPPLEEAVFHFSHKTIANLKEKANSECGSNKISSLLALLAHVWRCVTRARKLPSCQETSYGIAVGNRQRLHPPLTENYFGNAMQIKIAKTTVGELLERDLGWAASLLYGVVESHDDTYIRSWLRSWVKNPNFSQFSRWKHCDLGTGSSPRFNVYGNDFGWGKPVAVRSGGGAKIDGKMTVYPGVEEGSIDMEACLSLQTLKALADDPHFVEP